MKKYKAATNEIAIDKFDKTTPKVWYPAPPRVHEMLIGGYVPSWLRPLLQAIDF